jgi:hypothetical protein
VPASKEREEVAIVPDLDAISKNSTAVGLRSPYGEQKWCGGNSDDPFADAPVAAANLVMWQLSRRGCKRAEKNERDGI